MLPLIEPRKTTVEQSCSGPSLSVHRYSKVTISSMVMSAFNNWLLDSKTFFTEFAPSIDPPGKIFSGDSTNEGEGTSFSIGTTGAPPEEFERTGNKTPLCKARYDEKEAKSKIAAAA